MLIVYVDSLGIVQEEFDTFYGIAVVEDTLYFTTADGINKQIKLAQFRGITQ